MRKIVFGILVLMFTASLLFSGCAKKKDQPVDLKKAPAPAGGAPASGGPTK